MHTVMNEPSMRGRVALVAGASKGIGAATAEAFAAAGAAVVLAPAARRPSRQLHGESRSGADGR